MLKFCSKPSGATDNQRIKSEAFRLAFLDGLRGYAIIMVVATHATAYVNLDDSTVHFLSFWVQAIAVPPFFLADGYLLVHALRKQPKFSYVNYCVRSAKRLLIPWVLFNLLYLSSRAIFEFWGHPSLTVVLGHSAKEVLLAMYYSEISAQLYFLPALFFIRAASIGTRYLVMLPAVGLLLVWLVYVGIWETVFVAHGQEQRLDPLIHAIWGFQYYLLGMVLGIQSVSMPHRPYVFAVIAMLFLGIATIAHQSWAGLAQYAYLLGMYFMFVALGKRHTLFSCLGGFTMGIYLFHAPVVLKFLSSIVGMTVYRGGFASYLVIVGSAIVASLVLAQFCRNFYWGRFLLGEAQQAPPVPS